MRLGRVEYRGSETERSAKKETSGVKQKIRAVVPLSITRKTLDRHAKIISFKFILVYENMIVGWQDCRVAE